MTGLTNKRIKQVQLVLQKIKLKNLLTLMMDMSTSQRRLNLLIIIMEKGDNYNQLSISVKLYSFPTHPRNYIIETKKRNSREQKFNLLILYKILI